MGLSELISGMVSNSSQDKGNVEGIRARQQAFKDIKSGALSNTPSPTAQAAKPSTTPSGTSKARYGDGPGEKRIDVSNMVKPLGSFKKGGKVKKTGPYKLHKGERVLNPKQTKKAENGGLLKALGVSK